RKLYAPWERGRFAPTTTGGETSLPTKEISNRDSRRASVSSFPPGKFIAAHQQVACQNRGDQTAVKNSAGTQEVERQQLRGVIPIFRFGEEHQDLRTDQRRHQHP